MRTHIRNTLAKLILRYSPAQRHWRRHIGTYLPILEDALENAPAEQLLTLRIMDDMDSRRFASAQKRLDKLRRFTHASANEADKALYCVLMGDYHFRQGQAFEMAHYMRQANRHGHHYHLPYLYLGIHDLYDRWVFDRASEALDKAISCVYKYPPLDEDKRRGVAVMQTLMSLCATMMHAPEEAERLLTLAAPAEAAAEYHHASAALHAVAGHAVETESALTALCQANPRMHDHWCEGIRLMLAGTHPHFTAREPDMTHVRRYWEWFVREEETLAGILTERGGRACVMYQQEHFGKLYQEKVSIDMMGISYRLEDGKPTLTLAACHSRTCEVLIDALMATCPQQISSRWLLHRF